MSSTLKRKALFGADFGNLFWISLNSVTNATLTFVFTPLFLSAFGFEDYAFINIWITVNVILLVFDLGINLTINNIIAADENSLNDKQNYFLYYERVISRRISYFVSLILVGILFNQLWFFPLDYKVLWIIILISISSTFQFLIQYFYNAYLGLFLHRKVSQANILFLLLRFGIGYIFALIFSDILIFFVVQLAISIIQYLYYRKKIFLRLNLKRRTKSNLEKSKIDNKKNYITQITILSFASISLAHLDRLWAFSGNDLTQYSIYAIAFSGASIIQLVIQPLYKTYFSRYSQQKSAPIEKKIRSLKASLILSSCLLSILGLSVYLYAEALLQLWLGDSFTNDILYHFKLALLGLTLAGYFWLPAAYMQANGYPQLHNIVIILSIAFGMVCYFSNIIFELDLSPAIIWVGHGLLLIVIEGYYMFKKVLQNHTYGVIILGLFLPIGSVLLLYTAVSRLSMFHEFIDFIIVTVSVFSVFGYILYKKDILHHAFQ